MPATETPFDVRVLLTPEAREEALRADVLRGLRTSPKAIPPVWFYDERGSILFDEITRLPEYYPTRTERAILDAHASEIARRAACDTLVELGSGTSEKTHLLLRAMALESSLGAIVTFDVSEEILRSASAELAAAYGVPVCAVVGDFHQHLAAIPANGRRLFCLLGGTIGNLAPPERAVFLASLHAAMSPGDHLLLGTDLVKAPERLVAAYDDAAGVTAAFNKNVLEVINGALAADFDQRDFAHVARWNAAEQRIEMHLRALRAATVTVEALGLAVEFAAGEEMLTEISSKFTPQRVEDELVVAGFVPAGRFLDPAQDFLVTLAARAAGPAPGTS